NLAARVQPRLEGALVAAMFVAIAASAAGALRIAGGAAGVAGVLALVRMARWRLWSLHGRPDLLCLAAGYLWLAAGLFAVGLALAAGAHLVTALHLVTVGAIGTLTVNVMALTWLRLARRDPARAMLPVWGTALVAVAALARVAADLASARAPWLALAAASWSLAYVLLLVLFVRVRRPPRRGHVA
ncbi:MAG TPA: NnrS family protein, partial [Usitatibacter sp.]|nr:NnrS family protein [Usitatibacter sp.]